MKLSFICKKRMDPNSNNNICRYCAKKCEYSYINKCHWCGSICCINCAMTNDDVGITYYYSSSRFRVDSVMHFFCIKECIISSYPEVRNKLHNGQTIHSNLIFGEISVVMPKVENNWIPKHMQKYLLTHLIKDITNLVIEYM